MCNGSVHGDTYDGIAGGLRTTQRANGGRWEVRKRMRGRLAADGRQYGRQWMESSEGDGGLNFLHAMSMKISRYGCCISMIRYLLDLSYTLLAVFRQGSARVTLV